MDTINISITTRQTKVINQLMTRYGYANRSEFFRSLLRVLIRRPELIKETEDNLVFKSPPTRSAAKVLADFRKCGKYSKAFLKDLERGLKDSSYFK
jgi:Arc/MetJ-type ribon-helix-helix transcriptional regulator